MTDESKVGYGYSKDLFVTRKANGESIVVGGVSSDTSRWVRILSHRAAQLLWFQMIQLLQPDGGDSTTMNVMTAPMRDANRPTITTHMNVERIAEKNDFQITGWAGEKEWDVNLTQDELKRFCDALSSVLYPNGIKH